MRPLALALALLVLSGCAATAAPEPAPTARPLTTEESQRLAITRFTNFDEGAREVSIVIGGSESLTLTGLVDFATHRGYVAAADSTDPAAALGLVTWNLASLAVLDGSYADVPLPAPEGDWKSAPLDPSAAQLDAVLAIVLNLGSDRPDNPTLLQQGDGFWVRSDSIDGVAVDVLAGPSSDDALAGGSNPGLLRYWVDDAGRLLRLEVSSAGVSSTVDFGAAVTVDTSSLATVLP